MALVPEGHARAFEVVFDRHAGPAFSLAYRICGRRTMAEEVVQEAFLSLWRSGARYDPARGSVRSWVLGVVRNRSIDALRRHVARDAHDVADEGFVDRLPSPELTDVLGALEAGEAAAFSRHLAACPICRDEVQRLRAAAERLPLSAPQLAVSRSLRRRVRRGLRDGGPDAHRRATPRLVRPRPSRGGL